MLDVFLICAWLLALYCKVAAIMISSHNDSSEWTTKGKRRKNFRQPTSGSIASTKIKAKKRKRRPAAEGEPVDPKGDGNEKDEDPGVSALRDEFSE